jgi:hypothetical protein
MARPGSGAVDTLALMWEYRWHECHTYDATALGILGDEGWEAVGMTPVGEHFGRTYLAILMKRPVSASIDLLAAESDQEQKAS